MSLSRYMRLLFAASVVFAGCEESQQDLDSLDSSRAQMITDNGFVVNGFVVNGFVVNGFVVNGFVVNGFVVNGFVVNGTGISVPVAGISITDLALNGVKIIGLNQDSIAINGSQISLTMPFTRKVLTGAALKGLTAKFSFPGTNGSASSSLTLRIDDVYLDTSNKFKDVWLYRMSSRADNSTTWQSTCKDYAGKPAPLVPLMGSYWDEKTGNRVDDPKSFTLACVDGAIGKCVSAGYRPWATAQSCTTSGKKTCTDVALKEYHQACTRMIRADYCGDGTPHTVNGTVLDIFDYLSPPVQLREETWNIEARWNADGAICLSKRRHPEIQFPGCYRVTDKKKPATLVQLPACQAYSTGDDRGLVVSTFTTNP